MKGSSKHIFMTCFVVLTFCFIVSSTVPAQTIQNPQLPELQFSQVPPASRAKYIGDRFSYMEVGPKNAPVLLLAHGVGANSMHWLYQYPVLGQRYRVIAWNAPGYMLTDNLVTEEPTCKDYADAMNDFLASLGIEKVSLFGNSIGSLMSQCFAGTYPQKVSKMILTGTLIGEPQAPEAQKKAIIEGRQQSIKDGGYSFGSGRVAALVGKNTTEDKLTVLRGVLRATNPRGYMQAIRFAVNADSRTLAPKLTMPVLIIVGGEDQVTPPNRNAYLLKPLLAKVKLLELPNVGHLPEFEVPDVVNKAVLEFLAD
jgi:pimeloyl-ACP methyl ester carboxylesterase